MTSRLKARQDTKHADTPSALYQSILADAGYDTQILTDTALHFKQDDQNFLLAAEVNSPFVAIAFPNFYAIESADKRQRLIAICHKATAIEKGIKFFVKDDQTHAMFETFVADPDHLAAVLPAVMENFNKSLQSFNHSVMFNMLWEDSDPAAESLTEMLAERLKALIAEYDTSASDDAKTVVH